MRKPKQYPNGYSCTEYGFKNPALCRENGVLTSYCCICHTYIGNEYDTNWYTLIKQEYCPACRKQIRLEQGADRQQRFRRNHREERKLLTQQNHLLKEENQLLRKIVNAYRDDLDQLCCQLNQQKREDPAGE